MQTVYRVEWFHNGNWRMEVNNGGEFKTIEEATNYSVSLKSASPTLITRIVEVEL